MRSTFDIKPNTVAKFVAGKTYGVKGNAYFFRVDSRTGMTVTGELFDWNGNSIKYYKRKRLGYFSAWANDKWVPSKVEFIDLPIIDGGFNAYTNAELEPKDIPRIKRKDGEWHPFGL